MTQFKLKWKQQARQMTFLRACGLSYPWEGGKPSKPQAKVIGYGGAAGGGKSDALMMCAIIACISFPGCSVGYFRRTYTQLEGPGGAIIRSMQLLKGLAKYNGSLKRWVFPNGSILQFCHIQNESDVHNYQSQQFDVILFDEATQFTWSIVSYMMTRNRATVDGVTTFVAMATNPGNVGHAWFKTNFVEAGEPETPHLVEVEEGKFQTHMFIPAKLSDNAALETRDPEYRKNLENQPELIRRQLLDGDWDIADGVAFTEWRREAHVCEPFAIPDEWYKFRSLDWGYAKPYAVGWYAIDFDGRLYKYRELYGWNGKIDTGSKADPEDVAKMIIKMEEGERIYDAVADDAIFGSRQDNSPTIAEQFADAFIKYGKNSALWRPVGKGPKSRVSGKLEFHHRLKVPTKWDEDLGMHIPTGERPMVVFFNTCTHTIRTIPNLILDEDNPEDVDTSLEDHLYDETRYAMMSRPMVSKPKEEKKNKITKHKEELIKKKKNSHLRRII